MGRLNFNTVKEALSFIDEHREIFSVQPSEESIKKYTVAELSDLFNLLYAGDVRVPVIRKRILIGIAHYKNNVARSLAFNKKTLKDLPDT